MLKEKKLKKDGWLYEAILKNSQLDFKITPPENFVKPKELFKLYSPVEYAVDSLTNDYLYGNHPMQFNDLFDCHKGLIICDDEENNRMTLQWLKETYGKEEFDGLSDIQLEERIIEGRYDLAYVTFGITSLTSDPNNVLMWAYYGNNQGYMVEYDVSKFPQNYYGPFPVNYQEKVSPISHKLNGAQLALLYQSNIKSKAWEHESEWRYLIRSEDGKPLIPYNVDIKELKGYHYRKFKYPKGTVKSISLGNRFFSPEEIQEISEDNILKVKFSSNIDYRIQILTFIILNKIELNYGLQQVDLMSIKFRKCIIEQKGKLEFWLH